MALAKFIVASCKPVKGTWRVVFARWGLYLVAMLPGLLVLTRELNESVGRRPYFQELQLPLGILDLRLLSAELSGGGTVLMVFAALVIWILQLVWLGGATHLFGSPRRQATQKVFRTGWQYLGRFVRVAVFALIATAAVFMALKFLFLALSARAEIEDWSVQAGLIDLHVWRAIIMSVAMTLIGIFAFWVRVMTVVDDRRDLRRLPMAVFRIFRRRPLSALLFQFAAVVLVLSLQAVALVFWRQSTGGLQWAALWAAALFFAAWVWQLRIRVAIAVLKSS
jgi:hypothetical protein